LKRLSFEFRLRCHCRSDHSARFVRRKRIVAGCQIQTPHAGFGSLVVRAGCWRFIARRFGAVQSGPSLHRRLRTLASLGTSLWRHRARVVASASAQAVAGVAVGARFAWAYRHRGWASHHTRSRLTMRSSGRAGGSFRVKSYVAARTPLSLGVRPYVSISCGSSLCVPQRCGVLSRGRALHARRESRHIGCFSHHKCMLTMQARP
jgi:hypothetical protein